MVGRLRDSDSVIWGNGEAVYSWTWDTSIWGATKCSDVEALIRADDGSQGQVQKLNHAREWTKQRSIASEENRKKQRETENLGP